MISRKINIRSIAVFPLLFSTLTFAHTPSESLPSVWDGSQIQFGLNMTTGNSNTSEANAIVNLAYAKKHWENNFDASGTFAKSNGVISKQKYTIKNEAKYGFDIKRRHFLFARASWAEDSFSPYSYQTTVAFGYGRDVINTQRVLISVQVGPGYRNEKVRNSRESEERIIATVQAAMKLKVTNSAVFKQVIQYDSGPPFHYVNAISSFNTKFSTHWSTQVAFDAEYYSHIPPMSDHTKKLDTTTTVSIVYSF